MVAHGDILMKIKIFLNSAGSMWQHDLLTKFAEGVERRKSEEDVVEFSLDDTVSACDVAVIFGSWKDRDKGHHIIRSNVATRSRCFVVIETALLGRKVKEENTYWRVGVNGFLNHQGKFLSRDMPGSRYTQLNLPGWQGWKNNPQGHIVMLLQLPGDASLRRTNIWEWALYTISEIRKYSEKPIVIRPHPLMNLKPGDEFFEFYYKLNNLGLKNISVSDPAVEPLKQQLNNAYCTVSFTSGSSIDSIIEGIPVIAMDPGNFAWDVSSRYPEQITDIPRVPNQRIEQWLWNLAWSQWNKNEMKSGQCWEHLLPICKSVLDITEEDSGEKKKKK